MKTVKRSFTVVGMQYRATHELREVWKDLVPFRVKIEREPENTHDENAIAVLVNQENVPSHPMKIGYLRRQVAAVYAPEMDSGNVKIVKAKVTDVDPDDGTAEVQIWLGIKGKFALDKTGNL